MARVNLRAAFMVGVGSPVAAHQVFADRVDEIAAFSAALSNLEADLDGAPLSPVADRGRGRRNVLVFYGVGGIGKTTLSQELERRFLDAAEGGDDAGRSDAVAVRVDLADAVDVLGLPGAAQRGGIALFRTVRDRIREHRLLAGCDLLAELMASR